VVVSCVVKSISVCSLPCAAEQIAVAVREEDDVVVFERDRKEDIHVVPGGGPVSARSKASESAGRALLDVIIAGDTR